MSYALMEDMDAAYFATSSGDYIVTNDGQEGNQSVSWGTTTAAPFEDQLPSQDAADFTGPGEPIAGSGVVTGFTPTQHEDFNFRLWMVPATLNLTNPPIDTDIAFKIWSTFHRTEELISIDVDGSSVLSFSWAPGETIRDGLYGTYYMQIAEGEPTISAEVTFNVEDGLGILYVIAVVSSTFNLIPDVPVKEKWLYKTDILTSKNGKEQRFCLREKPRISQEFTVEIIDTRQRKEQYAILERNIKTPSLVPFYQYCLNVNGASTASEFKVYCETAYSNFRVGGYAIVVHPSTEKIFIGTIDSIDADGVNFTSSLGVDISAPWVISPAITCLLDDGVGILMDSVTGSLSISAKSFYEPTMLRPGEAETLTTLDSLPVLTKRPLTSAGESFEYRREVLDNETGVRHVSSDDPYPKISGRRRFTIQRMTDYTEMDFWRKFFDTVKGGWKPFLLSTYFPDWTLRDAFSQGDSTFTINEEAFINQYKDDAPWQHFEIEWNGGDVTRHTILTAASATGGGVDISFSPAPPNDTDHATPVRISYLIKLRAGDEVTLEHWANYSEISFTVYTTGQET